MRGRVCCDGNAQTVLGKRNARLRNNEPLWSFARMYRERCWRLLLAVHQHPFWQWILDTKRESNAHSSRPMGSCCLTTKRILSLPSSSWAHKKDQEQKQSFARRWNCSEATHQRGKLWWPLATGMGLTRAESWCKRQLPRFH